MWGAITSKSILLVFLGLLFLVPECSGVVRKRSLSLSGESLQMSSKVKKRIRDVDMLRSNFAYLMSKLKAHEKYGVVEKSQTQSLLQIRQLERRKPVHLSAADAAAIRSALMASVGRKEKPVIRTIQKPPAVSVPVKSAPKDSASLPAPQVEKKKPSVVESKSPGIIPPKYEDQSLGRAARFARVEGMARRASAEAAVSHRVANKEGVGSGSGSPWWLNPPPWWLPPPPEWGAPPPSVYSPFYSPYSSPQPFHTSPQNNAYPAYSPQPLPY